LRSLDGDGVSVTPAVQQQQVDILHRATHLTAGYEDLSGSPLYAPHHLNANNSWQDNTNPSSITSPPGPPGSIHSDTSS
ncbi:hypothetical protein cypCar_00013252, partial [Cyprinus carpio]